MDSFLFRFFIPIETKCCFLPFSIVVVSVGGNTLLSAQLFSFNSFLIDAHKHKRHLLCIIISYNRAVCWPKYDQLSSSLTTTPICADRKLGFAAIFLELNSNGVLYEVSLVSCSCGLAKMMLCKLVLGNRRRVLNPCIDWRYRSDAYFRIRLEKIEKKSFVNWVDEAVSNYIICESMRQKIINLAARSNRSSTINERHYEYLAHILLSTVQSIYFSEIWFILWKLFFMSIIIYWSRLTTWHYTLNWYWIVSSLLFHLIYWMVDHKISQQFILIAMFICFSIMR